MNGIEGHLIADPTSVWQWLYNAGLLIFALIIGYYRYTRPAEKIAPGSSTTKVQEFAVSGVAQITDMNPIRDLVSATKSNAEIMERCAIALEQNARANEGLGRIIADYIEDTIREREIEREVKARLKDAANNR